MGGINGASGVVKVEVFGQLMGVKFSRYKAGNAVMNFSLLTEICGIMLFLSVLWEFHNLRYNLRILRNITLLLYLMGRSPNFARISNLQVLRVGLPDNLKSILRCTTKGVSSLCSAQLASKPWKTNCAEMLIHSSGLFLWNKAGALKTHTELRSQRQRVWLFSVRLTARIHSSSHSLQNSLNVRERQLSQHLPPQSLPQRFSSLSRNHRSKSESPCQHSVPHHPAKCKSTKRRKKTRTHGATAQSLKYLP